jgi:hypothetical protein
MNLIKSSHSIAFILLIAIIASCSQKLTNKEALDPLPSWSEGETKASIISFVEEVTDDQSNNYVAVPDRVAVFDNDGNLWSEKPIYFQLFFAIDMVKALAEEHPEWETLQPFKSVLENDLETLAAFGEHGILEIVMGTHSGYTTEEFEDIVKDWLVTARHPRFDRPYTDLVYQPMLELLRYLQENDFKTFIVSGGGIDFMRTWVEEVYEIPREQVIGSSIKTEYIIKDGIPAVVRLPEIDFINDKEGKPLGINKFIGRKPIFCSGNSDGDLAMMNYTASGEGKRFMLYLHHTDSIREWAYDRNSPVGRLDKGLDVAREKGWSVINMKEDWKVVYPFELTGN